MPTNRTETQLAKKPTATELFPDFSHRRVSIAFVFFAACAAFAISAASAPWHPDPVQSFWSALALCVAVGGLWISSLRVVAPRLKKQKIATAYLIAWALLMAITGLSLGVCYAVLGTVKGSHYMPLPSTLIMAAALGGLALRYFYIHANWQLNQERGQIARSQALAARIRPHFLFNTLNTIAELTRADPEAAEHAVEDLARLYRMSLADVQHKVPLADEINTAKSYLYIEQYRLGSRMRQTWDTDRLPADAQLPILTLQPLVENAIYHGIEPCPDGGHLRIEGWSEGDRLYMVVTNPIPEIERSNRQKGNNMATENIRQRLQMAFGKQASMQTEKLDQQYQVTLRFPYVTGDTQG
jgi:two-component system sensor histidine kinase AlgZ